MSTQRKQLYLGVKLNEDLTDRFLFFQEQSQLNAKDTLKLMIIQSTDALGYLEKKKNQEIPPLPLLEELNQPSPTKEALKR